MTARAPSAALHLAALAAALLAGWALGRGAGHDGGAHPPAPTDAARPGHAADSPLPSPDDRDVALLLAAAGAPTERAVELVLDRGELDEDGAWLSGDTTKDTLGGAAAPGGRARLSLSVGTNVVTVQRAGCAPSHVPLRVGALPSQSLPYPGCGAGWTVEGVATEAALRHFRALVKGAPGDDGALGVGPEEPARWLDHVEAAALCAWLGGALPESPGAAVPGLAGEWLRDGTIALFTGGSRASPTWAREADVGARCGR